MNVAELKDFLKDIPDDVEVLLLPVSSRKDYENVVMFLRPVLMEDGQHQKWYKGCEQFGEVKEFIVVRAA